MYGMTNLASIFKSEIARIARKEVRLEIDSLKKASTRYRAAIAELRRQVTELQKEVRRAPGRSSASEVSTPNGGNGTARRFSASRLAAHRAKLGLSAAAYGKLFGMSGATVYLWEQGKSRPNAEQLQRLATVRSMSKRTVMERASQ